MKKGWTYRKLGDVCDIICGQDYKAVQDDKGPFPIYGTGGIMGYASQSRCPAYSVIIGRKGSINNPLFVEQPFWNVDTAFGVVPNQTQIQPKYFYYFCKDYDFTKHDVSVTIPSLRRTDLLKIQVPVPPLSEQDRIVTELDLLQGIIDKQKAQLKELDTLAQSIFYDMFGDPVENEKRWTIKRLKEACAVITDGTHNSPISTEWGDFKYITAKNIKKDGFDFKGLTYVSASVHKEIYARCAPQFGDVLFIKDGATTGVAMINSLHEEFSLLSSVALIRPGTLLCNRYLRDFLNHPSTYRSVRNNMGGAAITRLTLSKIGELEISLPPISLQQSYATKIEAIERQKASINASIAETQKLFDYTMDKYFG